MRINTVPARATGDTQPSGSSLDEPRDAPASQVFDTDVRLRAENEPTQLSVREPEPKPSEPPPAVSSDRYLGAIIDGRYLVESVLGEGGMGFVYRCRHKVIDKLVAIKILRQEIARDPEVTNRFVNEAKAASAVGNPHIVDTIDFGQLPDGATYFVMEYLEGKTLSDVLAEERALGLERIVELGRQIAEGLGAAHDVGIVHRDLKPDNVFVIKRGKHNGDFVKILDFGIAKVQSSQNKLTRAGSVFGTPHYMSPEQARGAAVDPRTDVYALGVILYELAAGQVPFDADSPMSILSQHVHEAPRAPSALPGLTRRIPHDLEAVILKCLAKDPDARYQSMAELGDDLDRLARGHQPSAAALPPAVDDRPTPVSEAPQIPLHKPRLGWLLLAAAGLALASVAVLAAVAPRVGDRLAPLFRRTAPSSTEVILNVLASSGGETAPAPMRDGYHEVALIMLPIDAEAFVDEQKLGAMPVTLRIKLGETVTVQVRRDGYYARRVVVDGSKARVVVRLQQLPGARSETAPRRTAAAAPKASASGAKPAPPASAASAARPVSPELPPEVRPDQPASGSEPKPEIPPEAKSPEPPADKPPEGKPGEPKPGAEGDKPSQPAKEGEAPPPPPADKLETREPPPSIGLDGTG